MPYGQQVDPQQYAAALNAFDALQKREQAQTQMNRSGNPFAILGAALGGLAANKFGKHKGKNLTDVNAQIEQYHAQQKAIADQRAEAKQMQKAQAKYERDQADQIKKFQREQAGRKELKQFDIDNRAPQQASQPAFNERMFNQLNPNQKAAYMNKFAGMEQQGGNPLYSKEEQAIIARNPEAEAEIYQNKVNEAKGVKPDKAPTGEAQNKLGLLETAERDLLKYMDQAFVEGDYQEVGSKFGNTNDLFNSAVMNTLRAESGAAIGKDEVSNFQDTYGTSMFRSDETNMSKVQGLLDKIRTQKQALGGQKAKQVQPQEGGLSDEDLYNKY